MMALLVGGIIVLLLICLLRGSIYLHLYYIKNLEQDYFEVKVYLFDFWKIHQEIRHNCLPMLLEKIMRRLLQKHVDKRKAKAHVHKEKKWSLAQKISKFSLPQMMKLPWICRQMSLKIKVSSPDAAQTALIYGGIQALMPLAYRYACRRFSFVGRPRIQVAPCFDSEEKEFLLQCIISVKIGNLVYILKN